jgi:hypothetical protein
MHRYSCGTGTTHEHYGKIIEIAERQAMHFLAARHLAEALASACHYLTLGVDVRDIDATCETHAELVGVYDTKQRIFVRWTGKSYPVQFQVASLMYCRDLKSHFMVLDGLRVMVLGCHDLNIFSNRSRRSSRCGTYKATVMEEMDRLVQKHKPEVVLHHPHYTDSPRVWQVAWAGVRGFVPTCHTYSSGIFYGNRGKKCRGQLKDVLSATAHGYVVDWIENTGRARDSHSE